MEEQTWTIVQFLEDMSVEAVPTLWLRGDLCYWPPYKQEKLTSAIKKQALDTNWSQHKVKVFRNATFDNYARARVKAKSAEDCSASDLYSDPDIGKRKRFPKVFSSSSSDDSLSNLECPIKAPRFKKTKIEQYPDTEISEVIDLPFTEEKEDIPSMNEPGFSGEQVTHCCLQQEHQVLVELKNQNHMLRGMITDVLKIVTEIKQNQRPAEHLETSESLFVKYNIQFPIKSEEDFLQLDTILLEDYNYNNAVKELSKFGGSSPYNFIKRVMSTILSDNLIIEYSWLGRKGKRSLESTMVGKLFVSAADKSGISPNKKKTEEAIRSYMKRGKERLTAKENKNMV
ncbi:uncharacterized protein LOC126884893 [Diabrotica virgifera virgifera]|uniref:Uncharacterized protein LOC114329604 n=1 Tax=Diabrotica virgifera virgifera TaxID=50390 RepID=A0A6P7FHY5_DIAVI|nr:uncharacterized protein LOC126883061 [Diabrotica virgifera virgifera]XP_050504229.1 uncharacterized protein LOC126883061 [Diabrotica virgifera virgifera]XP_050507163.1 uncharacterized protein LOC126884893 [Diabrotica virgifera virgifera]XP_050507164.1 uncharacterized protein LOC126884893 [Diabrotica virgifera virgifera]